MQVRELAQHLAIFGRRAHQAAEARAGEGDVQHDQGEGREKDEKEVVARQAAPENLDWVAASLFLYRAFLEAGGQRALFAGSCAEYDWSYSHLAEASTPVIPRTLYGRAKNALRELTESYARLIGAELAWGRVFFLYGPGEVPNRLVSDLIRALDNGRPALCTDGGQQRDFMHVWDAARAFATVLESDFCGPINIASGVCSPVADAIRVIARLFGQHDLIRLGEREHQADEPPRLAADVKLLARLGFRPDFDLEAGLAQTVATCRAHQIDP